MEHRSYRWVLILLVLVFAIAAIVAYRHNHQRAGEVTATANLASYKNSTYGYSFSYPADDTVRVASEEDIIVGVAASSAFVTYAEARIATSAPDAPSYDAFVTGAAKALCTAEPGYVCTDVAEQSGYTTETDLAGTKLYLDMQAPGGTPQRFGPIYAFNIGGNVREAKYAALFIYRPLGAEGAVETLPAEDIARGLSIGKAAR